MKIEIESSSGFCFGVLKAVEKAEAGIREHEKLYCLGDIVHNEEENKRLQKQGLIPLDHASFKKLTNATVLLRAHGEPPETYKIARQNNIRLIDGTCPIVLQLQQRVKQILKTEPATNVIIVGKKNHPEVIGLSGQVDFQTQVVSHPDELQKLDLRTPIYMLSQTTMAKEDYEAVQQKLRELLAGKGIDIEQNLTCLHSVCGKVAGRRQQVFDFASRQDVVVFVAGRNSSNGRQLFEVCKSANENSFFISASGELNKSWFTNRGKAGVCGATSTPQWLLQEVARKIEKIT